MWTTTLRREVEQLLSGLTTRVIYNIYIFATFAVVIPSFICIDIAKCAEM